MYSKFKTRLTEKSFTIIIIIILFFWCYFFGGTSHLEKEKSKPEDRLERNPASKTSCSLQYGEIEKIM